MSDRWKCPHCQTVYRKTSVIMQMQELHRAGKLVLGDTISCPECRSHLDQDKALRGLYDLPNRPTPNELNKEAKKKLESLMIEGAMKSLDSNDLTKYAVNQLGEFLFQKYGLDKKEIIDIVQSLFD